MTGFDQLERELLAAERRLSDGRRSRRTLAGRRFRFRIDLAAAGLAVLIALVVGVGALVLVGHRSAPQTPTARRTPAELRRLRKELAKLPPFQGQDSSSADLRALRNELAVFRSPQTAAARRWLHGVVFQRLTRRAVLRPIASSVRELSLPHHVHLILYLTDSRPGLTGVGDSEWGGSSGGGACCIRPQALRRPIGPGPRDWQSGRIPPQVYFEIVPDGVTEVRWTFARHGSFATRLPARLERRIARRRARLGLRPVHTKSSIGDPNLAPLTVTVAVHNNVAAMYLPNRGPAVSDTWFSATGRVIAHRGKR